MNKIPLLNFPDMTAFLQVELQMVSLLHRLAQSTWATLLWFPVCPDVKVFCTDPIRILTLILQSQPPDILQLLQIWGKQLNQIRHDKSQDFLSQSQSSFEYISPRDS